MDYATVALGTSYRVCGYGLKPLTLGHVFLIESLSLTGAIGPHQLAMGIFICSRDWRKAEAQMQSNWFALRFWFLSRWVGFWFSEEKMMLWAEYLDVNMETPKVVPNSKDGASSKKSPLPWLQFLRMYLMVYLHYQQSEVWNANYKQAVWDAVSHMEHSGSVDLHNPEDWDEIKDLIKEANSKKE